MSAINIAFLDHVALRVRDIEVTAAWYEQVLGLERKQVPEWDPFPVLMLAGKTGIALFPLKLEANSNTQTSSNKKIDHFAFRVDKASFEKVIQQYQELKLDFNIQNHHYFQSIYTNDPDGNQVEVTCLLRDDFFDFKKE